MFVRVQVETSGAREPLGAGLESCDHLPDPSMTPGDAETDESDLYLSAEIKAPSHQ